MKLNPEQRSAVAAAVTAGPGRKPMTLFGPPGTGKTVVLVELALQLFHQDPDARLLICAPQNFSADLLCSRLAAAGITPTDMIRCNDPRLFTTRVRCPACLEVLSGSPVLVADCPLACSPDESCEDVWKVSNHDWRV